MDPAQGEDRLFLTWLGEESPHLDSPETFSCGNTVLGVYGGNRRAGADKNEDAALILVDPADRWEFAVLLDAHFSAESARLVLEEVENELPTIRKTLDDEPLGTTFRQLEHHLVQMFSAPDFRNRARRVHGEASCLICARKDRFLWWMCIGDCVVYLFHRELASLGQFALNQRSFYEWVGFRNTFDLPVPCYSSGVRELRLGRNVICMATDGLFEFDNLPTVREAWFYRTFMATRSSEPAVLAQRAHTLLDSVHQAGGRDSATLIAWSYENSHRSARPSG